MSYGTTLHGAEFVVACEGGDVIVLLDLDVLAREGVVEGKLTTRCEEGKGKVEDFENERTGVPLEVRKRSEALVKGE